MKKYLLLVIFFILGFTQVTISQEVKKVTKDSKETNEISNIYKFRHWSIAWNGGMSIIDADVSGNNKIVPNSFLNFAFNAQVEYMITPMWGFYAQYSYIPYSASRGSDNFKGLSHDITLNGTVNILNLFRSDRSRASKWGLNINVGAGVGFYNTHVYAPNDGRIYENEITEQEVNSRAFVLPVGLSLEYAPVECLGIFLQAEYRMYQADDIDALVQGRNSDYMGYAGIGLRYKIAANKKRNSVKTISLMDHNPDKTDRAMIANKKHIEELAAKVDNMTDMLNSNLVPKLEALEKAQEDNTDTDLDGVPDNRDRHPNTPAGSFVNYYGEPLTEAEINKILGFSSNKPEATVYYELNSHNVSSKDGELAIAKVANKLYNNPNYKAEIIGYCDNSGSDEFNQKLSLKRAETVKNILVKKYGIDANRITVVGKGKTQGPKDKFIVNRRCDVFIVK